MRPHRFAFLSLSAWAAFCVAAVPTSGPAPNRAAGPAGAASRFRVGAIQSGSIPESSGLAASRKHAGVFWTLNDSGNPPALFAITREGTLLREYRVAAENVDWEDLAVDDDGRLYIADTGNNDRSRKQMRILRVGEPDPRAPLRGAAEPLRVTASWRLAYPAAPFDCESLVVLGGKGFVIPKRLNGSVAEIYRFDLAPAPAGRATPIQRVAELTGVRAPVTGASVSADGRRLAVLTVLGPHVFDIHGDVAAAGKAQGKSSRYFSPKMEAACFVPEGVLVTTEDRDVFLFRDEDFH